MSDKILALDFDGTLVTTAYPEIGRQRFIHWLILQYARRKRKQGWKIVLWTLREDWPKKKGNYLSAALDWCNRHRLPIDYFNENPKWMTDEWGESRKLAYDLLIDDKAAGVIGWILRRIDR